MRIKSIKFQYLIVLSANICVLILGFVISIVTTHIMDTAEYGYYKAFINSLMMLTSLSNFGFHMTYAREFANSSSQEYEKKLVGSSILINLGIAIIVFTGTVVVCLIGKISGWYQLDSYILLASVFVFLLLLQYLCLQRMQGQNRMLEYALITLIPQIVLTGFYLVEYLKKHEINAKSSITVYVAANAVVLMWLMFERGVNFRCDNELCHVFKVNKGYGFNIYIGALASVTSAQILSLLIATIAGLEEYALFSLGLSIASPMMYIPVTMGTVQFKKNIQFPSIPIKELVITFGLTAAITVAYFIFVNFLLTYFIGENYKRAIPYSNILMIYYIMMGIGDYFNKFVCAKGNGKMIRNCAIIAGIVLIVGAAVLTPLYIVNGLIVAKLLSACTYLCMMIIAYRKTIQVN